MFPYNEEQKLIAKFKNILGASGSFIGDDCAVLPDKLLVTTDTLVEQTHFNLKWTEFDELGWKAMTVNLSDIAAMAGIPKYALIVISAPADLYKTDKIISLYEGLNKCAKEYNTAIVGGDISRGPLLSITITIIGQSNERGALLRSSAKPGDVVIATGDFGASYVGLRLLQSSFMEEIQHEYPHCLNEFLLPKPRLHESWQLIKRCGRRGALMDTSDGLADALLQIANASNVGMEITAKDIPIHNETYKYAQEVSTSPLELALYGGEDYQLLACLPMQNWLDWQKECPDLHNSFKQIGVVTENTNDIHLIFDNEKTYKLDPNRIFQHI